MVILKDLHRLTGQGAYVFPSIRTAKKPLSENTFNAALRRAGYSQDEATAHGFRASASTLLNESKRWHPDAIERQLAHVEEDEARKAYPLPQPPLTRVKKISLPKDFVGTAVGTGDPSINFMLLDQPFRLTSWFSPTAPFVWPPTRAKRMPRRG